MEKDAQNKASSKNENPNDDGDRIPEPTPRLQKLREIYNPAQAPEEPRDDG